MDTPIPSENGSLSAGENGGANSLDLARWQACEARGGACPAMSEKEFAAMRQRRGARIVFAGGHCWQRTRPGFYEPVSLTIRLAMADARQAPAALGWGYRTALLPEDAQHANGSIPLHLLADVEHFDLGQLSANRRAQARKCARRVEIVQLLGPALLRVQGYDVLLSAQRRTLNPYSQLKTRPQYEAQLDAWINARPQMILAGLVGGKLGGFLVGYAVEDTAFVESVEVSSDVLTTNISTGLHLAFIESCRRSGHIRQIVHSMHIPENAALTVFKEGLGFKITHVPAFVRIHPLMARWMRRQRPYAFYRLTGNALPLVDHAIHATARDFAPEARPVWNLPEAR